MNTLLFNILGSFAQFERDLIVEKTKEGREGFMRNGNRMGRKPFSSEKDVKKSIHLYENRDENGLSAAKILRSKGIRKSALYVKLKGE